MVELDTLALAKKESFVTNRNRILDDMNGNSQSTVQIFRSGQYKIQLDREHKGIGTIRALVK